ncbi:unnamed protein product [Symbiodinium sp. CCMP2592]|nr:unnamed protein product [Symbiodinium sp. CCMP2592]
MWQAFWRDEAEAQASTAEASPAETAERNGMKVLLEQELSRLRVEFVEDIHRELQDVQGSLREQLLDFKKELIAELHAKKEPILGFKVPPDARFGIDLDPAEPLPNADWSHHLLEDSLLMPMQAGCCARLSLEDSEKFEPNTLDVLQIESEYDVDWLRAGEGIALLGTVLSPSDLMRHPRDQQQALNSGTNDENDAVVGDDTNKDHTTYRSELDALSGIQDCSVSIENYPTNSLEDREKDVVDSPTDPRKKPNNMFEYSEDWTGYTNPHAAHLEPFSIFALVDLQMALLEMLRVPDMLQLCTLCRSVNSEAVVQHLVECANIADSPVWLSELAHCEDRLLCGRPRSQILRCFREDPQLEKRVACRLWVHRQMLLCRIPNSLKAVECMHEMTGVLVQCCYGPPTEQRRAALLVMVALGVHGCKEMQNHVMEDMPNILQCILEAPQPGELENVMKHLVHCHRALHNELRQWWVTWLVDYILLQEDLDDLDFFLHKLELLISDVGHPAWLHFPAVGKLQQRSEVALDRFLVLYGGHAIP